MQEPEQEPEPVKTSKNGSQGAVVREQGAEPFLEGFKIKVDKIIILGSRQVLIY